MVVEFLILAVCACVGIALQRRVRGDAIRDWLWRANLAVVLPLAATYAFLAIDLDRRMLAVVACAVVAWWLTVGAAGLVARLVTGGDGAAHRSRRGALWLVGAFPNTGFLGFPLARIAYGDDGLQLAIVYDQVSLLIPAIVVGVVIAARHADPADPDVPTARPGVVRAVLSSPPVWAVLVLVALRLTVVRDPVELELLGAVVGAVVGPIGFFLLGLSIPLHGVSHGVRELGQTSAAIVVRMAVAPLLVWAVASVARIEVPAALYLIAAMPTAFHALVVARVYRLDVGVLRAGIVLSSVLAIAVTAVVATVHGA